MIVFSSDPLGLKIGYLVYVDGVPWAYFDYTQLELPPAEAKTLQLDTAKIEEAEGSTAEQPSFVYLGR